MASVLDSVAVEHLHGHREFCSQFESQPVKWVLALPFWWAFCLGQDCLE